MGRPDRAGEHGQPRVAAWPIPVRRTYRKVVVLRDGHLLGRPARAAMSPISAAGAVTRAFDGRSRSSPADREISLFPAPSKGMSHEGARRRRSTALSWSTCFLPAAIFEAVRTPRRVVT